MTSIMLELKLALKKTFTWVLYLVCILSLSVAYVALEKASKPAALIRIHVVNLDQSLASKAYVKALSVQPLLQVISSDATGAQKAIRSNQTEAVLTIPKDFFTTLNLIDYKALNENSKLQLSYRAYDALAPALVDILAQDLMLEIGAAHVVVASERHLPQQWHKEALSTYYHYIEEYPTDFTAMLNTVQSLKGLKTNQNQYLIQTSSLVLGYGLALIIMLITLQRAFSRHGNKAVENRLQIISRAYWYNKLAKMALDIFLVALPWSILLNMIATQITLAPHLTLGLWVMGLIVLALYSEILAGIYALSISQYMSHLLAVGTVIISALAGGAFFPLDLLPKALRPVVNWLPLAHMQNAFYNGVSTGTIKASHFNGTFAMLALLVLITFAPYLHKKIQRLRPTKP